MNTFEFSITGAEKIIVNLSSQLFDDQIIKKNSKEQLHIPDEDDFDVFDENYNLVEDLRATFHSGVSQGFYKICIINKL